MKSKTDGSDGFAYKKHDWRFVSGKFVVIACFSIGLGERFTPFLFFGVSRVLFDDLLIYSCFSSLQSDFVLGFWWICFICLASTVVFSVTGGKGLFLFMVLVMSFNQCFFGLTYVFNPSPDTFKTNPRSTDTVHLTGPKSF